MVRASNPSAATCGKRKLIPSSVERRGSIGRCCHASVRGCVACFSRISKAIGIVRQLAAPMPRAMVRKALCEAFSVFCMLVLLRQGSVVKKSPSQLQLSHRVTLSEAKGLSRSAERSFASLRMTGLTLSVGEELSRSFEPCLKVSICCILKYVLLIRRSKVAGASQDCVPYIFISYSQEDRDLYALDALHGTLIWRYPIRSSLISPPAVVVNVRDVYSHDT